MKNTLNIQNPANSVIADTGFWVAIGSANDPYHRLAIEVASNLAYDPVTTWPVITESCYLLLKKQGAAAAEAFLASLQSARIDIFGSSAISVGRKAEF